MILAESTYRGTTAAELSDRSRWDSFKAAIDQRAIFPRSGTIRLHPNRLELTGRDPGHDVTIHPGELASVSNEFTDLYGRFLGGGSKTLGAPLVLELHSGTLLYLLVNHRWFTERTDNAQWSGRLTQWLTTHREAN
ncbi:hypothetical protein AB0E69_21950 [Kribbella sp. NPDC026611]|uniref:hypothetical protein n=1 Tax=Kribbella sp. NPDC026611 TaxID=3154911 RepID=UPI0033D41101